MKKKLFLFLKIFLVFTLVVIVVSSLYVVVVASSVSLDVNNIGSDGANFKIFDKNQQEIRLIGYRKNVEWEKLPQNLIDAFVSIEDKKFFSHNGVDATRILKATVKNLLSFDLTKEGASTITQQLIKNTHLTQDKTLNRKIKEIKLALDLEKVYTKEEIFTSYLNVLYFGNSIYGVNDASYVFFGKNYTDLTLSECAILASVVKSPANYSPLRNYDNAISRRNLVLNEMMKDGYISQSEYEVAIKERPIIAEQNKTGTAFINAVISEATSQLGISEKELAYGGYHIYTNFDQNLQEKVEDIAKNTDYIPLNNEGNPSDVCIYVCDNEDGLVNAYYGSTQSAEFYRQPGSTIKPFVSYMPSLSKGTLFPSSPVLDEREIYGNYSPQNYGNKYIGWTNTRYAVAKSINSVAVKLMNEYGVRESITYATRFGLRFEDEDYTLATALGGMTKGVTPLELSSAYMALANGGYYKKVGFIKYITDKNGENITIFDNNKIKVESAETCYLMTDMLYDVVKNGTASMLSSNYKIASKTGTVQNGSDKTSNNDLWNISYTSKNTLCVWMGNPSNSPTTAIPNGYTAGVYPTRVAKKIYDELYKNSCPTDITIPENVVKLPYSKYAYENERLLLLANEFYTSDEVSYDIFDKRVLPEYCDEDFIKEINFDDLIVKISKNRPTITFTTQKGVNYVIMRSSLFDDWSVVSHLNGSGEKIICVDDVTSGDYQYKIEAYVVNYAGDKKYISTSNEYFVSIPYDLWLD